MESNSIPGRTKKLRHLKKRNIYKPKALEHEKLSRRLAEYKKKVAKLQANIRALREDEEKFRLAVQQASDGIAIIQDGVFRFVNLQLAQMGGYTCTELTGQPFKNFLTEADLTRIRELTGNYSAVENRPVLFEMVLRRKDGEPLFTEISTSLISLQNRPSTLVIVRDLTKRKKAENLQQSLYRIAEAAISSESLDDLFRSIHQVISTLMPVQNFYIALFDEKSNTLSFPYFIDEYDEPPLPKKPGQGLTEYVLRTGKPLLASPEVFAELEARGEVKSIGAPSIDWLGVPLLIDSRTIGVLVVQTYTEGVRYGQKEMEILRFVSGQVAMAIHRKNAEARLKASLKEKEVLLREIHHRVKNNMQVVSSLLNLQALRISDPTILEFFRDSQRRIRSMALIHDQLYQSPDLSQIEFSSYLRNLTTHLCCSFLADPSRIRLSLKTEELYLNINTAIPCGLIVNELVSNAFKHAFPEGKSGHVEVGLRRLADDDYELRVRDDGVGFPEKLDFRQTETLGLQIVSTLVSQIEGELRLDRQNGTAFTLIFNDMAARKNYNHVQNPDSHR